MDVDDIGGSFLHELSMVERAQPRSSITGAKMTNEVAHVEYGMAPSVEIPLTAGRSRIAQLMSEVAGPFVQPPSDEPQSYPDTPTTEQLWCELLDDLGAYLRDLSHADPALRLVGVRRDGPIARIQVTNGSRELTYAGSSHLR